LNHLSLQTGYAPNKSKGSDVDTVLNILAITAIAGVGGIVFVGVGMAVVRAFDILENDYD
jgi:hypothetical protein